MRIAITPRSFSRVKNTVDLIYLCRPLCMFRNIQGRNIRTRFGFSSALLFCATQTQANDNGRLLAVNHLRAADHTLSILWNTGQIIAVYSFNTFFPRPKVLYMSIRIVSITRSISRVKDKEELIQWCRPSLMFRIILARHIRTRFGFPFALLFCATKTQTNAGGHLHSANHLHAVLHTLSTVWKTCQIFAFNSFNSCAPTAKDFAYEHANC